MELFLIFQNKLAISCSIYGFFAIFAVIFVDCFLEAHIFGSKKEILEKGGIAIFSYQLFLLTATFIVQNLNH